LLSRLYRRDTGSQVIGGSGVQPGRNAQAFNTRSGFKRPSKQQQAAAAGREPIDREGTPSPVFFQPKPKVRVLPPGVKYIPPMAQGLEDSDSASMAQKKVLPPVDDYPRLQEQDAEMEYSEPSHNPFAFIQATLTPCHRTAPRESSPERESSLTRERPPLT